jgi:hypothetical protein
LRSREKAPLTVVLPKTGTGSIEAVQEQFIRAGARLASRTREVLTMRASSVLLFLAPTTLVVGALVTCCALKTEPSASPAEPVAATAAPIASSAVPAAIQQAYPSFDEILALTQDGGGELVTTGDEIALRENGRLEAGDRIISINGQPVGADERALEKFRGQGKLAVLVERNGCLEVLMIDAAR